MSRRSRRERGSPPLADGWSGAAALCENLPLAAALAEADGRMVMQTAAWRQGFMDRAAAPDGPAMFEAFRDARRDGRGEARVESTAGSAVIRVANAGEGRFWLVREPAPRADQPSPAAAEAGRAGSSQASLGPAADGASAGADLGRRNRLEAIGQLAGGVAHDFNNLLSAIGLRADELLQRHPLGDPAYENLAQIRATVVRAANLANQLLAFASKATRRREVLDLGDLLGDLEVLLRRLMRANVRLDVDVVPDLPRILADPAQVETIVVNLVLNARDAISSAAGAAGRVHISARRVDRTRARAFGHGDAAGDMALIEVADNGRGIPPGIRADIFEPFFTTKAKGEGTGLGLATVYGIVKQSEGWIGVESPPGGGAVFRVLLPEHHPPLSLQPVPVASAPARPRDLSGVGRILLVEDEDLVRGVAARLLRGRGYEVIEAADGQAALALARENAGSISLMISDVVMPGLDGPALLKAARPCLGPIPVLFVSGYAASEFSDLLEGEPGVGFLAKPLDFKTLAERVKRALAEAALS